MKILVMKFVGTSVANLDRIRNIASIIEKEHKKYKLVIVLSAMAGVTNDLQKLIDEADYHNSPETDMIITFYYELPKLDCEASEIDDEIQTLEENYFGYESELETEVDSGDEYAAINCSWSISCESLFGDAPKMDEIIDFDDQVKEIINSHKK